MLYSLDDGQRNFLLQQPESGMGYQIAEDQSVVFLNAELAVLTPDESLSFGLNAVFQKKAEWFQVFFEKTEPNDQDELLASLDPYPHQEMPAILTHGSYFSSVSPHERYLRYTAFTSDRRIDMANRSILANTYVTTAREAGIAHSGQAAVSRFGLPNPYPAWICYEVRPTQSIQIQCGNFAPNFGQAGGGVEILLLSKTSKGTVRVPPRKIPKL